MNALILASGAASTTGLDSHTWALIIGGGIFVAFMLLLLVTVSYTNVGLRHEIKPDDFDEHRQFKTHKEHH
ncbi:hypothetical protein [Glutamicibacter sp. NPDC087344]|uniref:hypothetical protein n=1 Tax=Glutamicibacter sp. NPDC087344 TaxID=3363994 RepID=UPI003819DD03